MRTGKQDIGKMSTFFSFINFKLTSIKPTILNRDILAKKFNEGGMIQQKLVYEISLNFPEL